MLEMKLTQKSVLLDEAMQLQEGLGVRLSVLEHGLSWKDAQLQEISRQNDEACRSAASWQQRAERLEEENCVLRDALLEHADQNEQLQQALSIEVQARQYDMLQMQQVQAAANITSTNLAGGMSPEHRRESEEMIEMLRKQLKESNQKTLLVEEQLRIRSGFDPLGHDSDPMGAALSELALLPAADAWAVVGRGAADRICGVVPHGAMDFPPRPARLSSGIDGAGECDVQEDLITSGSARPEAPSAASLMPAPPPELCEVALPPAQSTSSVGLPVEASQQEEPLSPTVNLLGPGRSPRRRQTQPADKVSVMHAGTYLEEAIGTVKTPTDRHPQASWGPLSPSPHASQQALHQQQQQQRHYVQVPGRQAVAPTAATGQVPTVAPLPCAPAPPFHSALTQARSAPHSHFAKRPSQTNLASMSTSFGAAVGWNSGDFRRQATPGNSPPMNFG